MRIIFILIGFCCLLACRAGAAQPATQPPVATSGAPGTIRVGDGQITYYAQAGDTLSSIAQQLTTRSGNWVALGKLNRISKDISIPIGTAIVIPADLLPDEPNEARIVAFSGSVSASAANGAAVRIAPGGVLREGASLTTGANSFLTLALADQSRISIPSNSRVGLSRLRMARYTNSPRTEISILQGRVEARVAPLNFKQGRFEVRSPQSVTGVRGTHFRVAVAEERVGHGVLDGSVALTRPGATPSLILRQGQGAVISAAGTPTAVDLLPPPQLASAPAADGAALRFELLPVAGAAAYQVQIATDSEGQDIVAESTSATTELKIQGLARGHYFARLSAIDKLGLQGMPRSSRFALPPPAAGTAATLTWNSGNDADAYRLRIARDPGFRNIVAEVEVSQPRYASSALEPGRYYWQVAPVTLRDGVRTQQPFGATGRLKVPPAQGAPFVDDSDRDKLWLRWEGAPGQKYLVQVARDAAFSWLLLSATTERPEVRLTRPAFGTYYARVQALQADGSADAFSPAQAFVVTDHWIIHDGAPFAVGATHLPHSR